MGIFQNIRLTRRQGEVLHEKQVAWSLGFVSLLAGIVVGVIGVYIELSTKYGAAKHRIEDRWAFGVMAVLALYCVYLIYPYMKSTCRTVGQKGKMSLLGAGLIVGGVLIGARLVMFAFLGIVIIFVLRVAGSTFVSTLENAGKGISVPSFDIKLMDGTELYEDWGGGYRDDYGHHYEKVDGEYVQKD